MNNEFKSPIDGMEPRKAATHAVAGFAFWLAHMGLLKVDIAAQTGAEFCKNNLDPNGELYQDSKETVMRFKARRTSTFGGVKYTAVLIGEEEDEVSN
jgi:hypothetical protein